jgi:hypothetical protein
MVWNDGSHRPFYHRKVAEMLEFEAPILCPNTKRRPAVPIFLELTRFRGRGAV